LKSRLLAANQQILRIDREQRHVLSDAMRGRLSRWIERVLPSCDGVILSDYLKGVLSAPLIHHVATLCHKRGIPVVADPKGLDYSRYEGVDFITPNLKEAMTASHIADDGAGALARAGRRLLAITRGRGVVVTRGHEDTALFLKGARPVMVPIHPREVYDVTGAGDTFIAYFALALFGGHDPEKAVALGNLAGGLAVEKIGCVAVPMSDVIQELGKLPPDGPLTSRPSSHGRNTPAGKSLNKGGHGVRSLMDGM